MRFHDINSALAAVRAMILEKHPEDTADRSLKILEAGQIAEEDFFCHVTHKTWDAILHNIRKIVQIKPLKMCVAFDKFLATLCIFIASPQYSHLRMLDSM